MSSFAYFCIATGLEFLAGCGCLIVSHFDFKKVETDPSARTRAQVERFFAFFFFTASVVTAIGLYVSLGEQKKANADFNAITNELEETANELRDARHKTWEQGLRIGKQEEMLQTQSNDWVVATNQIGHLSNSLHDAEKKLAKHFPAVITPDQQSNFLSRAAAISSADKRPVWVAYENSSCLALAKQVRTLLDKAGYAVPEDSETSPRITGSVPLHGIVFSMGPILNLRSSIEDFSLVILWGRGDDLTNGTNYVDELGEAFGWSGLPVYSTWDSQLIGRGEMLVVIPSK